MVGEGLIVKALSGFYYVECGNSVIECKARGVFRNNSQSPLVGDRVEIDDQHGGRVISRILPRKNAFLRPALANIDKLFIVSAQSFPAPNTLIIDRLISIAESKKIEPLLIFNKSDLGSFGDFLESYDKAGIKYFIVSCRTGVGFDLLKNELKNGVCVFTGNTGVGKSSILNSLFSFLDLRTGEISQKLGHGRHTTRHIELFKTGENAYVADTPGFSSMDIERYEPLYKDDLQYTFREFQPYLGKCRFSSCSHTGERGCAVGEAVEQGKIGLSRYENYISLYNEIKGIKEWEIQKMRQE